MPEIAPQSIVLSRHLDLADLEALYARRRRGEVVRLHRGAYVESALWRPLDDGARHRALATAVAAHFGPDLVFSHLTAAALWRLPRMGAWPSRPHVAAPRESGGRSTAAFVRHAGPIRSGLETIDGLTVTSLHATVVDVASTVGFSHGVVLADAALRRNEHPVLTLPRTSIDRDLLRRELLRVPANHGASRAGRVIEFADGRADRPGESMSRVSMHLAGVTAPEIQVAMLGASGLEYTVDFWWEEFNLIGEFDGKYKYTDPQFMSGRTAQQVLYDEKVREDDLRAASHGFSRWPWNVAVSPTLLQSHLARAGVR